MGYSTKKLIKLVDGMPAFPPSVYRILKLTADINCAPKDLVRVIDHDPVLTLKLLQLVNSPYFGLSRQISSIKQAVVFVGINTIKNLALTIAPLEMLSRHSPSNPWMDNLLAHAIGVGVIAKHLARRLGISEVESTDFFVAGLLHDIGKMALYRFDTDDYDKALQLAIKKKIPLHMAERHVFGVDHTQVGAMLGDKWCLPLDFVACMGHHHTWNPDMSPLQDCVFTANIIAKKIKVGESGDPVTENSLPRELELRLGCKLPELIGTLGDLSGEMNIAQILIHP
ncbi:MAG: HDOD domain-containing protein [Magnetococcales bacterium]|nr:HDOD domain-containing protein [Magnetococcales bacterium]